MFLGVFCCSFQVSSALRVPLSVFPKRPRSGGHEDEQVQCSQHGVCKFNGGGTRKRWTAHEDSVTVTALWLEPTLDVRQAVAEFRRFEMPGNGGP